MIQRLDAMQTETSDLLSVACSPSHSAIGIGRVNPSASWVVKLDELSGWLPINLREGGDIAPFHQLRNDMEFTVFRHSGFNEFLDGTKFSMPCSIRMPGAVLQILLKEGMKALERTVSSDPLQNIYQIYLETDEDIKAGQAASNRRAEDELLARAEAIRIKRREEETEEKNFAAFRDATKGQPL